MKKFLHIMLSRRFIVIILLLLQLGLISYTLWSTSKDSTIISISLNLISIFVVVYVINRRDKSAYKITWISIILTIPLFGGLLYMIFKLQSSAGRFKKLQYHYQEQVNKVLIQDNEVIDDFQRTSPEYITQVKYLANKAGFPLYNNTSSEYLSPGERFFEVFLEELQKAEKFIFIEFFIISRGKMWGAVLDILKEKAKAGIDVRLMYDDVGSMLDLPNKYYKTLEKYGIKCTVFNPFRPLWTAVQNNRDHRKIVVIDGLVAFTGGVNLADEYINEINRFGYWLDAAIILRGDAVWSFTAMFLHIWNSLRNTDEDYLNYKVEVPRISSAEGYIQPYSDSPIDSENVSEHVYTQIINSAKRYVYIETPYFIVDENMLSTITLAAKSGVDIRIITPSIPDKWLVHMTTRSYYPLLIDAGVRVYEYTPGFIHSKVVISDDINATIGSPNFDFRSLYLHYECGTFIHKTSTVLKAKEDFLNILQQCREITHEDVEKNVFMRLLQSVLRLCAPLL